MSQIAIFKHIKHNNKRAIEYVICKQLALRTSFFELESNLSFFIQFFFCKLSFILWIRERNYINYWRYAKKEEPNQLNILNLFQIHPEFLSIYIIHVCNKYKLDYIFFRKKAYCIIRSTSSSYANPGQAVIWNSRSYILRPKKNKWHIKYTCKCTNLL